jgi:uncharacterized phage-associated protein
MTSFEREKLFEAIAYFLANTKHCGLVKLFKLLYYADMLHFRETGRSITGMRYQALPYGPVPTKLYNEIRNPPGDLNLQFEVTAPPKPIEAEIPPPTSIKPRAVVPRGFLTKREQRILSEVSEIFRDVNAKDISDVSHAKNGPWDLAVKRREGKWGGEINFIDSVNIAFGTGAVKGKAEVEKRVEELKHRESEHQEGRKRAA